jgi:hypothetical protein
VQGPQHASVIDAMRTGPAQDQRSPTARVIGA